MQMSSIPNKFDVIAPAKPLLDSTASLQNTIPVNSWLDIFKQTLNRKENHTSAGSTINLYNIPESQTPAEKDSIISVTLISLKIEQSKIKSICR